MAKNFLQKQINRKVGGLKRSAKAQAMNKIKSSGSSGCLMTTLSIIGWAILILFVGLFIYISYLD